MGYIVGKMLNYAEQNFQFSRFELAKLKYMLELIILNIGEMLLFAVIFIFLGRGTEFLVASIVLLSVRSFAGGFHLAKFRYCVLLSFIIFWAVIMVLPAIDITQGLMEILLIISIVINVVLAPVSKRKSGQSPKSRAIFKCLSTAIILVYAILLLRFRESPFVAIAMWTIFIQSIQLIIGKVLIANEKNDV